MSQSFSTSERALQLARAGTYRTVNDMKRRLSVEGFQQVNLHLSGSFAKAAARSIAKCKVAENTQ